MEEVLQLVCGSGGKDKTDGSDKLLMLLPQALSADVDESTINDLVSGLHTWLKSSNMRVCAAAMGALEVLSVRLGHQFRSHVGDLVPTLRERLGDTKEQVRKQAQDLLLTMMEASATPQHVLEALMPAGAAHKSFRVRQAVLACLEEAMSKFGGGAISVSRFLAPVARLLADPNEQVREQVQATLEEVYRQVGDRLRTELGRIDGIPAARLQSLMERLDVVASSGMMNVAAAAAAPAPETGDAARRNTLPRRSAPPRKEEEERPRAGRQGSASSIGEPAGKAQGGSISAEEFDQFVKESGAINVRGAAEIEEMLRPIGEGIGDVQKDWEQRVVLLKRLREMANGNAPQLDSFQAQLRAIVDPLCMALRDLRSGVSKEACVTIAKLADAMRNDFEPLVEPIFMSLLRQVVINVKIIADSANLCARYIIQCSVCPKLLTRLLEFKESKAVVQRRRVIEYVFLALESWPTGALQRQLSVLRRFVADMMVEADADVRKTARRAYWVFNNHFPNDAATIMSGLDASKQKLLNEDRDKGAEVRPPSHAPSMRATRTSTIPARPKPPSAEPPRDEPAAAAHDPLMATFPPSSAKLEADGSTSPRKAPARIAPAKTPVNSLNSSGPMRVRREAAEPTRPLKVPSSAVKSSEPSRLPSQSGARRVVQRPVSPAQRSTAPSSPEQPAVVESEPAAPRDGLEVALRLAGSSDWAERLESVGILRESLRSVALTARELKQIMDFFIVQFCEPHNRVFAAALDALCDFVSLYRAECPPAFLMELMSALLAKLGGDLVATTHSRVIYTLEVVRELFPFETQLSILLKTIQDPKHNLKTKSSTLEAIAFLLPRMVGSQLDAVYNAAPSDTRAALQRIGDLAAEPKSLEVRRLGTHVLCALLEVHPQLVGRMLAGLPMVSAEGIRRILGAQCEDLERRLQSGQARTELEHANGGDEDGSEGHQPAYDPEAYQGSNNSSPATRGHTPVAAMPEVEAVVSDEGVQRSLRMLSEPDADSTSTLDTLLSLERAFRENLPTVWTQFDEVLPVVLSLTTDPAASVRELAVRTLRAMVTDDMHHFSKEQTAQAVARVLECHKDPERDVLRAADDALLGFSAAINPAACVVLLEPFIASENGPVLQAAVKLLTKVLKRLTREEMDTLLPTMLPGLIKGYKHPAAEIRKAVVFALVEVHLVLRDALTPHLASLSSSQMKLLAIYISRAEEKLAEPEQM